MKVPVEKLLPNPDQPRTVFDQAELEGLAQSIKENGLIQSVTVEQAGDAYIILDGERRWRAHKLAGLTEIEVDIKPSSNHNGLERLTKALVANIQREQMGFVDEAKAFARLVDKLGSLQAVSEKTGKSVPHISGRLSLLELGPVAQKLYNLRKLPYDLSVIALLKKLPKARQDDFVSTAVTRGWKTLSILRFGYRLISTGTTSNPRKSRQPKVVEVEGGGHFDALAMVDHRQSLPVNVKASARATCKACSLYAEASFAMCKQCPLPDFLNRLAAKEGAK
jgi:ParB/RepB/Spo0J family partition protein